MKERFKKWSGETGSRIIDIKKMAQREALCQKFCSKSFNLSYMQSQAKTIKIKKAIVGGLALVVLVATYSRNAKQRKNKFLKLTNVSLVFLFY